MRRSNVRGGQVQAAVRTTAIPRPSLRKASEENSKSGVGVGLKFGVQIASKACMMVKGGVVDTANPTKRTIQNHGSENEPVSKFPKLLGKKPEQSVGCTTKDSEIPKIVAVQQVKGLRAVSKNSQLLKPLINQKTNITAKPADTDCGKVEAIVQNSTDHESLARPNDAAPTEDGVVRVRVTRSLSRKLQRESSGNESAGAITDSTVDTCASTDTQQIEKSTTKGVHHCIQCNASIPNQSDSGLASSNEVSSVNETSSSSLSSRQTTSASTVRDPLSLSDFVDEIFAYYRLRELRYVPEDYIRQGITRSRGVAPLAPPPVFGSADAARRAQQSAAGRVMQSNLTPFMRAVLVDWLVEIQLTFELTHEPLYIAVRLVDTYLSRSRTNLPVNRLQLLGLICILLGTKYEERQPPAFADLLELCDNAYNEDDLIAMELDVLQTVGYDLGAPLSYRFLRRYANVINESLETLTLARYVLEITLMLYEFIVELDSEMAAAALLLALLMKRVQRPQSSANDMHASSVSATQQDEATLWPSALFEASGYREAELYPLVRKLNQALSAKIYPKLQTVRGKYAQEPFFCVSKNYRQLTDDEIAVFERSASERDEMQIEAERRRAIEAEELRKKEALASSIAKMCTRCASAAVTASDSSSKPASTRRSATRTSK